MEIRVAQKNDLRDILELLADDETGASKEDLQDTIPSCYIKAFERIQNNPNTHLVVATKHQAVIACLQLTFIPHLTFRGGQRALIEAVRVRSEHRHSTIAQSLIEWAIDRAKLEDCHMVQLSTNKSRRDSLRFYQSIGFESTHEGVKLYLKDW